MEKNRTLVVQVKILLESACMQNLTGDVHELCLVFGKFIVTEPASV
jgi:hypothetical protein